MRSPRLRWTNLSARLSGCQVGELPRSPALRHRPLRLLLGRPGFWVAAGLLAALAVGEAFAPLTGLLGYEFSLVTGFVGSIVAAAFAAGAVRALRAQALHPLARPASPARRYAQDLGALVVASWLLLVAPLALILLNALRVKNCDPLEGLAFYVALPCCSLTLAACLGHFAGLLLPWRGVAPAAAALAVVGSAAVEAVRAYDGLAVVFYDPFFGFLAAQGWDRSLSIALPLLFYRGYNLLAFAALALLGAAAFDPSRYRLGAVRRGRRRWLAGAAMAAAGAGAIGLAGGPLGFRPAEDYVAAALGGRTETEHFVLHHPRDGVVGRDIALHALDLEFRYDELRRFFGASPPGGKIRVWLYPSLEAKRRLFGAAETEMAKPWRLEVHLNPAPFPHGAVMHELAHVFAGAANDSLLRVPTDALLLPRAGLVEGIAEAAEWPARAIEGEVLTPHEWSAALRRVGLAPPIESIIGGAGFVQVLPSVSYTVAGSFVRFLVDRYGIARFKRLYGGEGFGEAYGKGAGELAAEWGAFVDALALPAWAEPLARHRFGREPIHRAVCAHELAQIAERAGQALERRDFARALTLYEELSGFDPQNLAYRFAVLRVHLARADVAAGRAEARAILSAPRCDPVCRVTAEEALGDLAWIAGDGAEAARRYEAAGALFRSEADARLLAFKRASLAHPVAAPLARDYLFAGARAAGRARAGAGAPGGRPFPDARELVAFLSLTELVARAPEFGPGHYVLGFQLFRAGEFERAVGRLRSAEAIGLADPSLHRMCLRCLGEALFRLGDLDGAAAAFAKLAVESEPAVVRLLAADWLGRIAWWRAHAGSSAVLLDGWPPSAARACLPGAESLPATGAATRPAAPRGGVR